MSDFLGIVLGVMLLIAIFEPERAGSWLNKLSTSMQAPVVCVDNKDMKEGT